MLIPQPTTPPISAAVTRSALSGACRRRPSSSMNAVPTSGIAISAATPAAPPATAAGRSSRRHQRPRSPRHAPAATPRYAAGASVPIAAPEATVARIASVRIGARRQGNRSSSPALSTTSPLMSARIGAGRKRPPRLRRGAGPRRRRLPSPVQHQHGDRQPEQRHHDRVPEGLAGAEVHARLEHQGHSHDHEVRRPIRPARAPRPAVPTLRPAIARWPAASARSQLLVRRPRVMSVSPATTGRRPPGRRPAVRRGA